MESNLTEYLNNKAPGLLDILKTTNVVISGSTVLYYKMKELGMELTFEPKDIDIYFIMNSDSKDFYSIFAWYINICEKYLCNDESKTNSKHSYYNPKEHDLPSHYDNEIILFMKSIILNTNIKIDLTGINSKHCLKVSEFIEKYSDFDFCKCWFDGFKIYTNHEENIIHKHTILITIPRIKLFDINYEILEEYFKNIKTKSYLFELNSNELNYDTDPLTIMRRIIKYNKRGFTINVDYLKL